VCQSPANPIAVRLVHQPVSTVLIFGAASTGINTVLLLELLGKFFGVHRLDIASNGVLHLDPITGILKGNPLHTIPVLSHNRRGCGRDGTRSSIRVHSSGRVPRAVQLAVVLGMMRWRHWWVLCLVKLQGHLGLKLWPGAAVHAGLAVLRLMLAHRVMRRWVRHHHVGLRRHRLLSMLRMLAVRRSRWLRRHGLVLRLRLIVHRLGHVLRRRLAVNTPVLVMLGR
jgi:hypothetical protein